MPPLDLSSKTIFSVVSWDKEEEKWLKSLGERIKHFRKANGMTQLDLSVKVDIDLSSVKRIESGRQNVGSLILRRIALTLNISLSDLLNF